MSASEGRPLLFLLALLMGVASCPSSSNQSLAVLDLDRVAKALGRDLSLQRNFSSVEAELRGQLEKLRDSLNRELGAAQGKVGAKPDAEQVKQLETMRAQAQKRFDEGGAEAQRLVQQRRQEMLSAFRDEVRQVARRIAARKNIAVVLLQTETVFDADPSVDLSNDVIAEMRKTETPAANTKAEGTANPMPGAALP